MKAFIRENLSNYCTYPICVTANTYITEVKRHDNPYWLKLFFTTSGQQCLRCEDFRRLVICGIIVLLP